MKQSIYKLREVCFVACLFLVLFSCERDSKNQVKTTEINPSEELESYFYTQLDASILAFEQMANLTDPTQILPIYKEARKGFKLAEPILSFVDKDNYLSLNQPNILKIMEEDATDIKIFPAFGFQVMEELLQEENFSIIAFQKQVEQIKNRLKLVRNTIKPNFKEHHILWLLRDQVVRVASLGITGFDSPLGDGLKGSSFTYQSLNKVLDIYQDRFVEASVFEGWKKEIASCILDLNTDFESFDRYRFIKEHTHTQLTLLHTTQKDWEVQFPFELALRNDATSLFTDSTFNIGFFNDYHTSNSLTKERVTLGKRLFNDVNLSKSKKMSCGTCHEEGRAFTDGLVTFPKQKRNTPTVKYAALQKAFFYDNRAGSLEGQIVSVVNNEHEFQSDLKSLVTAILMDSSYRESFQTNYGEVNDQNIRNAMANYIRSLSPFNSKFDQNINGLRDDLTKEEKDGFNLFMGKAQCATCHFAPTFNGTVPPYFTDTEMELLGVPNDAEGTEIDDDLGRYGMFKTEERKHFFKTPTVRNVSLTAPYMHNGVYETLEEVMTFYNHGGGVGMGFDLPYQTLPSDSLHLTTEEVNSLVAFMKTLEDE